MLLPIAELVSLCAACPPLTHHPPAPQDLDKHDPVHRDFWGALAAVAEQELFEMQKQEDVDRAR